jgi:ribosomal protein L34E
MRKEKKDTEKKATAAHPLRTAPRSRPPVIRRKEKEAYSVRRKQGDCACGNECGFPDAPPSN